MYQEHFGLRELPFAITPDPRFLFMSEQHRESLAHLLYGLENDVGFILLTGEVGAGKTTICRYLLDQSPEDWAVAFIINPRVTVRELLSTICDEFRIAYPKDIRSIKEFVDLINAYLLEAHAKGKKAVLIIDEAQNLSKAVLEQVRLLTNLETTKRKLLQIVLLGQPELRDKLARPDLVQLDQRIVARYHLGPLGKGEIFEYVRHRLEVAGSRSELFPRAALREIFRQSRGIPRLVNVICDRALLGAYTRDRMSADRQTVLLAAREIFGSGGGNPGRSKILVWCMAAAALIVLVAAPTGLYYFGGTDLSLPSIPHLRPIPKVAITEPSVAPSSNTGTEAAPDSASAPAPTSPREESQKIVEASASPAESAQDPVLPSPEQPETSAEQTASSQDPVPPNPEQPQPSAMQKLGAFAQLHGQQAADSALFGWWGLGYKPDNQDDSCRLARARGLSCYSGWGHLNDLRKWNRPAVLKLIDDQGSQFVATMSGMTEHAALFATGDETVEMGIDEFLRHWTGEYFLLWPAPPWFTGEIRKGHKGAKVAWIEMQLSRLRGDRTKPPTTASFSDAVALDVRRFQVANGLRPDGIVGPETLNRLLMLLDADSPVLTQTRQDL